MWYLRHLNAITGFFSQWERDEKHSRGGLPLMPADFKRMKRTPQVKVIRRALGLTQEEFAERFHIPLGTLRTRQIIAA